MNQFFGTKTEHIYGILFEGQRTKRAMLLNEEEGGLQVMPLIPDAALKGVD